MAKLELSSEQVNDFAHHIKQLSGFCGQPAHLVRVWPECHGPISVKKFFACRNTRKIRIISLFLPQQFPNKVFVPTEQKVPRVFADLRTNSF